MHLGRQGDPRRCFVHVGAPKTGTTAVQSFFASNDVELAHESVCYPRAGRGPDGAHHNITSQLRAVASYDPGIGGLEESVDEIARSGARLGVLSAEGLALLYDRPDALARMRNVVVSAGLSPRILIYVRRHADYVVSTYAEAVKFGRLESFPRYLEGVVKDGAIRLGTWSFPLAFEPIVRAYAGAFGPEALVVRGFVDGDEPAALVEDVLDAVGIGRAFAQRVPHRPVRQNVRNTTLEVMRTLWASTASHVDRPLVAALAEQIAARDPDAVRLPFDPLSPTDRERIAARFADDARALVEGWHVDAATFAPSNPAESKRGDAARELFMESERRRAGVLEAVGGDHTLSELLRRHI